MLSEITAGDWSLIGDEDHLIKSTIRLAEELALRIGSYHIIFDIIT